MNRKSYIAIVLSFLGLSILISSCGLGSTPIPTAIPTAIPLDKNDLAGNWQFVNANDDMLQGYEFYKNGQFIMHMSIVGMLTWTPGTYQIEGNRITLDFEHQDFETKSFDVTVSADQLMLRNTKTEEEFAFKRIGPPMDAPTE